MDAGREEEIRGESLRRGGEHTGNSGGGGRTAARSSSRRTSLSLFRLVLQARSRLMIVDDVLPRAPLPSDPSFHDGHSSLFSSLSFSLSLSLHTLYGLVLSLARSLARALALSLALLSRGHSVSTRATPLRAREWRLSRLARPYHRASALPSSSSCFPAYLPPPRPLTCSLPLSLLFRPD